MCTIDFGDDGICDVYSDAFIRLTLNSEIIYELSEADEIDFVSLQNYVSAEQAGSLPLLDILDFHPQLNDFADTAALMNCLDLVICVDTSIAHLAGCLGIPNWVLLKQNPDWRWLNSGNRSGWYQSTRLFRQKKMYHWKPVINEIRMQLKGKYHVK